MHAGNVIGRIDVVQLLVHPFDALFHECSHVFHLRLIASPDSRVLVNIRVHDGPSLEIQLLRQGQFMLQAVDEGYKVFFCQPVLSRFVPYFQQLCACSLVPGHNVVSKRAHVSAVASATAVDVVGLAVDGIGSVVVVKSQVKVPYGACIEEPVVALFVHENAPVRVGIARKFAHEEVPQKRVRVQVRAPVPLHQVELLADVVALLGGNGVLVGRLDGDGIALARGES